MAKALEAVTIAAPGFFGLNTQEAGITLQPAYATRADNCVIDRYGRLGARKGWEYVTVSGGSTNLKGAHNFIDVAGVETMLSWSDTIFYSGIETLSPIPNFSTAHTTANFDAANLNDKLFLVQSGDEPRYFDPVTVRIEDISAAGNTTANLAAITGANVATSAFGRLWLADTDTNKNTVYWSDLLDGTNFDSGSAGSIDVSAVLVKGNDRIVAIGAHVGRLIIFCENNIIIYGDTDGDQTLDPVNMRLVEVIQGVGCIARDSIQNTGNDLVFLARDGVRSLGRLIQEKSQPMRDLSKNIRDDLLEAVFENTGQIRSVYNPKNAFYLLHLPTFNRVYCFDTRSPLQDGSWRVTVWDSQTQTNMLSVRDKVYFTQTNGLAEYKGFKDNGEKYRIKYYTTTFDLDDSTRVKYVKRLGITLIGGSQQQVVFKISGDYGGKYKSYTAQLDGGFVAEYGVAEYNTESEYSESGVIVSTIRVPAGQSGEILQVGFEADIFGSQFDVQKLSIYLKQGRVY